MITVCTKFGNTRSLAHYPHLRLLLLTLWVALNFPFLLWFFKIYFPVCRPVGTANVLVPCLTWNHSRSALSHSCSLCLWQPWSSKSKLWKWHGVEIDSFGLTLMGWWIYIQIKKTRLLLARDLEDRGSNASCKNGSRGALLSRFLTFWIWGRGNKTWTIDAQPLFLFLPLPISLFLIPSSKPSRLWQSWRNDNP